MPEKPRDYEVELRAIMDALAESVVEVSDADILAEAREAGEEPARTAERVRTVLKRAGKDYEQKRLREAQKAYEQRLQSIQAQPYVLPKTPESCRYLFNLVMTRKPELGQALVTAQHREFKDLTDADIQSCLEQLGALGVLDEFERSPDAEG